jgi:kynurenine formamidase
VTTTDHYNEKAQGYVVIDTDWREYNWDTGLWDISLEYWASSAARWVLCAEVWTVGTDDWRSL